MPSIEHSSTDVNVAAVKGVNTSTARATAGGEGVLGISTAGCGVRGVSTSGRGVVASSDTDYALRAHSRALSGIRASSDTGIGVEGEGRSAAPGVVGSSAAGNGIEGRATAGIGVLGTSAEGAGVKGVSQNFEGVHAETNSPGTAALAAFNLNPVGTGAALFAKKVGTQGHAGFFDGQVFITGDLGVAGNIQMVNADCAENFDLAPLCDAEPGTVVRLADGGGVEPCLEPYDHRVAGVVSGAGDYLPGLLLDSRGGDRRRPVAMFGKVFCKVDARSAPVRVGDLLTSSATAGHAMRAQDREKAFGAVIGKALAPLACGCGLIPILVALN